MLKSRFFIFYVIIGTILGLMVPNALAANDLAVNSVRIGTHPDKTRMVIELSRASDFRAFMLQNPSRLVIDLPAFAWQGGTPVLPPGSLVTAIRNGALEPGISRIVVDVRQQVTVKDAFFLPASGTIPNRVVIDFLPVSDGYNPAQERMFGTLTSATVARPNIPPKPLYNMDKDEHVLKPPPGYPTETRTAATPIITESAPAPEQVSVPKANGKKPLIVIDPGHGGDDPGALGANGSKEKNVTLATAQELKRQLEASGRYRVHLTRSTDVFIKLQDRVAIGRNKGADLFISLHADSIDKPGVSGASIYTLSNKASDAQTAKLAARENRADLIAGVDLSHEDKQVANILIDLAMRDTMNQSKFFANTVVKQAQGQGIELLEKPHRFAGFAVLKAPDVPSVLIEMGFMSNAAEVSQLNTPAYRSKIAKSILSGIDLYFSKVQRNGQ